MRISDLSSYVCSSDLFSAQTAIHEIRAGREVRGAADDAARDRQLQLDVGASGTVVVDRQLRRLEFDRRQAAKLPATVAGRDVGAQIFQAACTEDSMAAGLQYDVDRRTAGQQRLQIIQRQIGQREINALPLLFVLQRSEEHTSELQSLMR